MIELVLSTLADFGLIREDYKHQKRISEKEKVDGIKRPFQKYVMQPSVLLLGAFFVIVGLCAILFFTYQTISIFPDKTRKEITQMSDRMGVWHKSLGEYPTDLNKLIGKSPIRQGWGKDAWNRDYKFTITNNGKGFLIISAGFDGQFDTEDDIKSK
ncbi:type II secretion system protein GspG [Lacinutrix undariae]